MAYKHVISERASHLSSRSHNSKQQRAKSNKLTGSSPICITGSLVMRPLEGWRPCFFRVLSTPTCIWFQWDGYWVGKIIGDASAIVGNRDGKKRENKKDSVMGRAGGTLNGENVSFRLSLVLFFFFFFFRVLLNQEAKSLCDNIAIPWTFRPRICVCVVMLFSIRLGRKWKSCPELSL